jgi:hypothetical protein
VALGSRIGHVLIGIPQTEWRLVIGGEKVTGFGRMAQSDRHE